MNDRATQRSLTVRLVNHRRWHDGPPSTCGRCAFTADELLGTDAPPPVPRRPVVRLTSDQQDQVLEVARVHGTTAAATWAGCSTSTVVKLRQERDGYTRGRGHPNAAEMRAAAVHDACRCPRCRAARGVNYPLLTSEEQAMVEANTGLVGFVLNRARVPAHERDDAFQNGLVGLMRATQKYDPTKGFTFSTYALHWIRAGIQKGAGLFEGAHYRRLSAEGRQSEYVFPLSLDEPVGGTENLTLGDLLVVDDDPAEAAADRARDEDLRTAVAALVGDPTDRTVLEQIAAGRTIRQLADDTGIAEPALRLRWRRIGSRLRHPTGRRHFAAHLQEHAMDDHWATHGACIDADPDLFFPERGASTTAAKEICRTCPVQDDCLEETLRNGEKHGIWGGRSERERRRLRLALRLEREG